MSEMRRRIMRARRAQQENEQQHDVQLEIYGKQFFTTCCTDELHIQCSGRVVIDTSVGWHEYSYTACQCSCHSAQTNCPVCGQLDNCGDCNHFGTSHYEGGEPEWASETELNYNFRFYRAPYIMGSRGTQRELYGPGPDCVPED